MKGKHIKSIKISVFLPLLIDAKREISEKNESELGEKLFILKLFIALNINIML